MRKITYCSFATEEKSLGVVILDSELDIINASLVCHALGINPGGQMIAMSCSENDSDVPPQIFEAMWNNCNRLISKEEAKDLFDAISIKEAEQNLLN